MKVFRFVQTVTLLVTLMFVSAAVAQTVTGTIIGEVTDPSGAVVSGAQVVAHNIDTGVDSPTTTNAAGFYRIQFLPIGRYDVTVEATGFNKETIPTFSLEVLQTPTFNVTMHVGSASSTVQVSAAAPILNTSSATLGTTITANTIRNFPLNGLNFSALTLYVPGSIDTAGTSGTTGIGPAHGGGYVDTPNMNGNRAQANNYTLDGIDMNETFNNLISYNPAPESLQEVKVLTANSPAQFGNVNGGGVVSVLKSGTNQFHGSAYGYVQDYRLNANSWTNNQRGVPINPFSQSQFGGALGGPIKRNKLFFFVDYLGSRYHQGGTGFESVFTSAMRTGDFSVLLAQPQPIQLYDPENGFAPYVGDKGIPVVNPVATFLFANPSLYPLPNATPTDGIANNNYQGPTRSYHANNQGDIKIEYDLRASDKITGFYSMATEYDGSTPVLAITFPGVDLYPTKLGGINWVHVFSPSLVNSARVGFTRTVWAQDFPIDTTGQFGTNGNAKVGITFPNQAYDGYTYQGISGGLLGGGNPVYGGGLIDNTYSYIDDLTWQRGLHSISIGVDAKRYQNNYPTANNDGYLGKLNYTGAFSSNPSAGQCGRIRWRRFPAGSRDFSVCDSCQRQCRTASVARGGLCAG